VRMQRWKQLLWQAPLLALFAVVPATLAQFLVRPPQERFIHIECFRYGKDPSVIRCNRGDRLHLTFSSRDTGHSFFLQEFDLDAKVMPGMEGVTIFRVMDPTLPPVVAPEVMIEARHPGLLGFLFAKSKYRCHIACGTFHGFEDGNLIIEPNTLLYASLGLLVGLPVVGLLTVLRRRREQAPADPPESTEQGWDIFKTFPRVKKLFKWRGFQFVFVYIALFALIMVILTQLAGGTKVPGRNFGSMLTWVVWMFLLTAVLTPLGGRLWCLACPLPFPGEVLQRMAVTGVRTGTTNGTNNRFFGLNLAWPKWLSNAWPRTLVFLHCWCPCRSSAAGCC